MDAFLLAIGCVKENATTLQEFFKGKEFKSIGFTSTLTASVRSRDDEYWVSIVPSDMPNPIASQMDCAVVNDAAKQLLEMLKKAPPFILAIVGYRADERKTMAELKQDPRYAVRDGLIVSEAFYEKLGKPEWMKEFSEGYYWVPFKEYTFKPCPCGHTH